MLKGCCSVTATAFAAVRAECRAAVQPAAVKANPAGASREGGRGGVGEMQSGAGRQSALFFAVPQVMRGRDAPLAVTARPFARPLRPHGSGMFCLRHSTVRQHTTTRPLRLRRPSS